jgi:hypothetical protein
MQHDLVLGPGRAETLGCLQGKSSALLVIWGYGNSPLL